MSKLTVLFIWGAVALVIFAIAWRKGYLLQISNYVQQTREELRKCTWPTWDELKGSTVLVALFIGLLGAFIFVMDFVFGHVMLLISKA